MQMYGRELYKLIRQAVQMGRAGRKRRQGEAVYNSVETDEGDNTEEQSV